jgi:hypothetical protein
MPRRIHRRLMPAAALLGVLATAGCTQTTGQDMAAPQSLPAPKAIIVQNFAASPDEVQLDKGLSAQIDEALEAKRGMSRTVQEAEMARKTADALAEKLVVEIRDLGLPAERGSALPAGVSEGLLITGQFVSIDEGNRTERVAVGLGAGRSDVRVRAQVHEVGAGPKRVVEEIEVDAKSGLAPGMAETMGAGALAGHLLVSAVASGAMHVVTETTSDTVVADADRAAKGIAKRLATFFASQGWTP